MIGSLVLISLLGAVCTSGDEVLAFDSAHWRYDERGADLVEHLGRESLHLREGVAYVHAERYRNFVMEFDIAFTGERGFVGAVWRMQDAKNFEHFYLRPHRSGHPDACQYTPVFHGQSGWQLYAGPGYTSVLEHPRNAWIPVKIEVWEESARIHVGGELALETAALGRTPSAGYVGLKVPGFAPAHFSSFRCRELEASPFEGERAVRGAAAAKLSDGKPMGGKPMGGKLPGGTITSFEVSSAFPESRLGDRIELPAGLDEGSTWTRIDTEPSGIANLARVQGLEGGNTAFARVVLHSDRERRVLLDFGFSDRVRVFLDGELLFVGSDAYQSRDHRFLGTVGTYDRLVLPLHEGANELRFAVSEDFGGWGVLARLVGPQGIGGIEVR